MRSQHQLLCFSGRSPKTYGNRVFVCVFTQKDFQSSFSVSSENYALKHAMQAYLNIIL